MEARRSIQRVSGLSLLELLVVMVILAILASIVVPAYRIQVEKAERVACMSHMRRIHGGLGAHTTDKGYWPQVPFDDDEISVEDMNKMWVNVLAPYGVTSQDWMCPGDKLSPFVKDDQGDFRISYVVTPFDAGSTTPYKWMQPWLAERAAFHPGGLMTVMPDGSVSTVDNPTVR